MKFPTLMGYKAAVISTLKYQSKVDFDTPEIRSLMKSFSQNDLKTRNVVPSWDVAFVLEALRRPPFEPIETCSVKLLTFKTAFLMALATGRRVSKLHAVQVEGLSCPKDRSFILCKVNPTFVAKNQIATNSRVILPFKVLALANILSPDMIQDIYLCPCRSIFAYMKRVDQLKLRGNKQQLFVPSSQVRLRK